MRKVMGCAIVVFLAIMLTGCGVWQNKATVSYLSVTSLVTVAEQTCKPSCDAGNLPADKCVGLKKAYQPIRQGCVAAGDTLILAFSVTDKIQQKNLLATYQELLVQVQKAIDEYVALYQEIVKDRKGVAPKYAISPEMVNVIVQAFVAIMGNLPSLIEAIGNWNLSSVDIAALTAQIQTAQAALPVW